MSEVDPFDLERFVEAQRDSHAAALSEIVAGRKRSHWMWYVFPQADGLGESWIARKYAIKSAEEARAYLAHPVLGARLRECATALLGVRGRSAQEIFGFPDHLKLRSSVTLFGAVAPEEGVFQRVLDRFWGGAPDERTLELLAATRGGGGAGA